MQRSSWSHTQWRSVDIAKLWLLTVLRRWVYALLLSGFFANMREDNESGSPSDYLNQLFYCTIAIMGMVHRVCRSCGKLPETVDEPLYTIGFLKGAFTSRLPSL
eukprot:TRINITY_DN15693_c1_g1_i1.p2 TRINITY_DN15693_c1_g1~~TRINITY_DN15693_c1_g1_i1.p2  ORF type:complete len:104 (+),score=3.79 TRINITY_DN15693_c1_g1_i1:317-628(+)